MLPKIYKSEMVGMVESIKEYLRTQYGVVRAPLSYIIRKTITVQTMGDYPMYATPDSKMIARMIHLPPNKKAPFREGCSESPRSYGRVQN